MDIVDVYTRLKKNFPHVDFIIEEVDKGRATFYYFKLRELLKMKYDPPVKTSICILKSDDITEFEFQVIERKMIESFSITKLLGV